jgi:hypothetical protein
MFDNTLCYNNVDDYDFLSCKMFSHWNCNWVKCCFIILQRKNENLKFIKNNILLLNKEF